MTADRDRAEAVRAVAHVLHGRLAPTLDAGHVAGLVLDALHEIGWRHVPRPPAITAHGKPGDYAKGVAAAREALAKTTDHGETRA